MNNSAALNNRNLPAPPSLHWAIVLVLSIVTFGFFGFVWMLRQAWYVRKLNPDSRALLQFAAAFALFLFSLLMQTVVALTVARGGQATDMGVVGTVIFVFQIFMIVSGFLQIRETLMSCFSIQMNTILTVLFNVYYVQYHLSLLAKRGATAPAHTGIPPLASHS